MQGRRIYPKDDAELVNCEPGDYGINPLDGQWYARTPDGQLAGLAKHQITVHEDETITVSPSILVTGRLGLLWHGYLEHGDWREA